MKEDFIFLSRQELPFLMNALKEMLEKKGISAGKCQFEVKALGELKEYPMGFVVDAALLNEDAASKTYLYDLCIEHGMKLIIIGEPEQVDEVLSAVAGRIVGASFKRPVNNQEVSDEIAALWEKMKLEGERKKILVVDDSPAFLRTMSDWLEEEYSVNICP